jgi:radical SAM superfamily enzyme YgiQ (UPF0313 family)
LEANVRGGHFWSVKKPEKLIEEIKIYSKFMDKHFGYRRFFFVDPLFGADSKWLKKFCYLLVKSDLNISWSCETRLDRIKNEVISLMRKSGCTFIFHGFESGSPRMLRLMRKTNNPNKYLDEALNVINKARENNLCIFGSYMLGYPGETRESLIETKEFIDKQINAGGKYFYPSLLYFIPYPGTKTYSELDNFSKKFGTKVLTNEISKYSKTCLHGPILQPSKELDIKSLVKFHKDLHRRLKAQTYNKRMAKAIGEPMNIDYKAELIDLKNPCCLPPK